MPFFSFDHLGKHPKDMNTLVFGNSFWTYIVLSHTHRKQLRVSWQGIHCAKLRTAKILSKAVTASHLHTKRLQVFYVNRKTALVVSRFICCPA